MSNNPDKGEFDIQDLRLVWSHDADAYYPTYIGFHDEKWGAVVDKREAAEILLAAVQQLDQEVKRLRGIIEQNNLGGDNPAKPSELREESSNDTPTPL